MRHPLAEILRPGLGMALDLGGGTGGMRAVLQGLGYRYVNLDLCSADNRGLAVRGDGHRLPFRSGTFQVVTSVDSLEHFIQPWEVVREIHRVLQSGGLLAIWVPFMHPFHGDDLYRYTPMGLRRLLADFEISTLDSPNWIFSVMALAAAEVAHRIGAELAGRSFLRIGGWLDTHLGSLRQRSFAQAYRILAVKP